MNNLFFIFFILYACLLGTICLMGFALQRKREKKYWGTGPTINPKDLVVLIPFRNEEARIATILKCINELNEHPGAFVFINDHSTDGSIVRIKDMLVADSYTLLNLPEHQTGKKEAIRYAIDNTDSIYILTIDADVVIAPDYFKELAKLTDADMYVLPAIMKAQRFTELFYEIDLVLANVINTGLAGFIRPIMASGANLLYRRDTFNRVDNFEAHKHKASGDDTYLLRDFRENGTEVRLVSNICVAVHTETPQSFREFIEQRLRWLGKTGNLKDHLGTSLILLQVLFTFCFVCIAGYAVVHLDWLLLLIVYGIKTGTDMLLVFPYFSRIRRLVSWFFIPIYELFIPIYAVIIVSLYFTYKPKWKGRPIYAE
jgi:cellulose synthase/poly-beta-1,6-N-acetylglucosamine synthase-like glycosyltransferase